MKNCIFDSNDAELGPAIYIENSNDILIKKSLFFSNISHCRPGGCGTIYSKGSIPVFLNVTFVDNMIDNPISGHSATSIFADSTSNISVINSILWNDISDVISDEVQGNIAIIFSDIKSDTTYSGQGNINLDPLFTNPNIGNYNLNPGSPCVDAGTADIDDDGIEDITDYSGAAPDMGALEYNLPRH